jgi:hypothetical protein
MVVEATTTPYFVKVQKLDRVTVPGRDAEDDHVRAGPDRGGVAAEVGAEGQ